jgi:outer membrane receptor protein involved in Fe transport
MNPLFYGALLFFASVTGMAKTGDILVCGTVYDAETGQPLAGTNIRFINQKSGTTTNEKGYFEHNLSLQTDTLFVSHMGYKAFREPLHKEHVQGPMNIRLYPKIIEMPEISIIADHFMLQQKIIDIEPSARSFNRAELSRSPSLVVPDVLQAAQALPFITAANPASTRLSIRGGDPDQNLFLMDGATLYYPYHSMDIVSSFMMDTIEQMDILPGGYSARYGDRLSSVVHVHTRRPSRALEGSLQMGLVAAEASFGIKFNENASFLFAARKNLNNLDQFFSKGHSFDFADIFAKMVLQPFESHTLQVVYFQNKDKQFHKETASYIYPWQGQKISYDYSWNKEISFENRLGAINYSARFGSSVLVKGHVSISRLNNDFDVYEAIAMQEQDKSLYPDLYTRLQQDIDDINRETGSDIDNFMVDKTQRLLTEVRLSPEWLFQVGVEHKQIEFDYGWQQYNNPWHPYILLFFDHAPETRFKFHEQHSQKSAFVEWVYQPKPWLQFKPGLRTSHWNKSKLEPRAALRIDMGEYTLKAAGGHFTQGVATAMERGFAGFLPLYFPAFRSDDIPHAQHFILSLEKSSTVVSAFYKSFKSLLKSDTRDSLFRRSKGESFGFEVETALHWRSFTGKASYVYSHARRTYRHIDYPARFDRRHQFHCTLETHVKNRLWITADWQLASGSPYSPGQFNVVLYDQFLYLFRPDSPVVSSLQPWQIQDVIYGMRYPWFHKLDLRIEYRLKYVVDIHPFLSFYNIYNRPNPLYYTDSVLSYHQSEDQKTVANHGLVSVVTPFIFNVGIEVKF